MTQFVKVGRIVKDRRALRIEIDGRNGPGDLVTDGIELYPYPDLHQRSILAQMPGPGDDEVRIGLEWVE